MYTRKHTSSSVTLNPSQPKPHSCPTVAPPFICYAHSTTFPAATSSSKSGPAHSLVMVMFLPHVVFKHILSFKDPTKQVGVQGGVNEPACVWYTWKERWTAPVGAIIMRYNRNRAYVCVYAQMHTEGGHNFLRIISFSLWNARSNGRAINDDKEPQLRHR